MLKKNINAANLDQILFELELGMDIIKVIQSAMEHPEYSTEDYSHALLGASFYLDTVYKALKKEIYTQEELCTDEN